MTSINSDKTFIQQHVTSPHPHFADLFAGQLAHLQSEHLHSVSAAEHAQSLELSHLSLD